MPTIEQTAEIQNDILLIKRTYKFSLAEVLKGVEYSVFKETGPDTPNRMPKKKRGPYKGKMSDEEHKEMRKAANKRYNEKKKAEAAAASANPEETNYKKAQKLQKLKEKIDKVEEVPDFEIPERP